MTTSRPPRNPARPPQSSRRQAGTTSSSDMSTSTRSSDQTNHDHLEGSFLLVPPDGEEDECSTVGSSLPDSIVFSDSEGHRDEGWESSNDGESIDERLRDSPRGSPSSRSRSIDSMLLASPSTDSYIDAEATNTFSEMNESRSTIHNAFESTSSSRVRLIMPDPGSSFLTSSDGTTPSGSFANIKTVPESSGNRKERARGRVDQGWLEASSRLWSITPEVQTMIEDTKATKARDAIGDYELLASQDEIKQDVDGGSKSGEHRANDVSRSKQSGPAQIRAARAAAGTVLVHRALGIRWSFGMSLIAMASLLSFSLLQFYGLPDILGPAGEIAKSTSDRLPSPPLWLFGTSSILDRFSSAPAESVTTSLAVEASGAPLMPDLQLIKQALSTFASSHVQQAAHSQPDHQKQTEPNVASRKLKRPAPSELCSAVSVRDSNTGLSVPPHATAPDLDQTWSRSLKRKLSRQTIANASTGIELNGGLHHPPCNCNVSRYLGSEWLGLIAGGVSPVGRYVMSAASAVGSIYRPVVSELLKEYLEVVELLRTVAETTSTLAEFVLRRASRGVGVSKQALEMASRKVKDRMPEVPHPHLDQLSLVKARVQIDHLSEYVEDQAALLADYVEEQSTIIQAKSLDSLRHAKKGLDKLIREARRAIGDDITIEESVPRNNRKQAQAAHGFKQRVRIVDKVRERRARKAGYVPVAQRKMEEKSRAGKLWDALHHGALALVI